MNNVKSPFLIENLENDTGFLLLQVSNLWNNSHDKALKKHHGLSHMQYAVLASVCWLTHYGNGYVTQSILSQHTRINAMTISQIFKVLEAKGYIIRTKHPTDIRAKTVNLTDEGNALMHKAFLTIWDIDLKFFKALGKNGKRFNKQLFDLLTTND